MRTTYREMYEEIRASRGTSAAEVYRIAIERDHHTIHGYESAYGREGAIDGAHGTHAERYAADAYHDLQRREECREEERRAREFEESRAEARRLVEEERAYYGITDVLELDQPEPEEPEP